MSFSQFFFSVKEKVASIFNYSTENENAASEEIETEEKFDNIIDCFSFNYTRQRQDIIIAKILEFSNDRLHLPNQVLPELTDYDIKDDRFKQHYLPEVYANGCDSSNQGHVSIVFSVPNLPPGIFNFEMTCIISLIDADGQIRFPQSYSFVPHPPSDSDEAWPKMSIDNYMSRRTLLYKASELLPCDTLTLHIDVSLKEYERCPLSFDMKEFFLEPALKSEKNPDGTRYFLLLNSLFAERLGENSEFFRQLLATPMKEKFTGQMELPREEYYTFHIIGYLMFGTNSLTVQSIDDIIRLYFVCEKYNILEIMNHAIHLLISCLSPENVDEISELADMFNDDHLKMTVALFKANGNQNIKALLNYCLSLCPPVNGRWFYKRLHRDSECFLKFDFLVNSIEDEETFDFYH